MILAHGHDTYVPQDSLHYVTGQERYSLSGKVSYH